MPKILVLGAGYAGLTAAVQLERHSEPVTLVNRYPYHYFTTLLHEAAGGRAAPRNYSIPIVDVLTADSTSLVFDEVTGIDSVGRRAVGKAGTYAYDYLIYALGWVPEYFGIPGLKEHSFQLYSLDSATNIRDHIERQFRLHQQDRDPKRLKIVVGGGGLTGVELIGELLDWLPQLCVRYSVNRSFVEVHNIETLESILPQVPGSLQEAAARVLMAKGASLHTRTKIVRVEPGSVVLDDGNQIGAGTIIWTGGVRANPLLEQAGFTVDRRGRARVDGFLRSVDDNRVFIGGDSAWAEDEHGDPFPPTAQIATQMGPVLADNVRALSHGKPLTPFRANLKGTLASLGREVGVGQVGGVAIKGVVAGLAKEATKVKYLWELGGIRLAAGKSGQLVRL